MLPVATSDTLGHPEVLGDGTGTLLRACALLEQPQGPSRNCAQALASHVKVSVNHSQNKQKQTVPNLYIKKNQTLFFLDTYFNLKKIGLC